MKYSFVLAAAAVAATASAQGEYSQCGGKTWTGSTSCPPGWSCIVQNPWYSQCLIPSGGSSGGSSNSTSTPCEESSTSTTPAATTLSTLCSGESGSTSTLPSYSTPAGSPVSSPASSPASTPASSMPAYSTPATTTPAASSGGDSYPTSSAPPAASSSASTYPISGGNGTTGSGSGTQFGGVNIAGCDFGCGTDGTCTLSSVDCPVLPNGGDGAGQMSHFVTNDKMNIFRLPVAWQFLVNDQCGGPLDSTNFPIYDGIVQSCLKTGASCIIDIHNYARWNGAIVGQGGPADSELADVWSQLATKYATEKNIIFGIMNEPHDLPDVPTWANTVQASVTAIRKAGATSQIILLPGDGYTGAGTFISSGSLAALQKVTNLDGSTTNLVFDVHQYLDSDGSGTSPDCTRNNIDTAFEPLAAGLRAIKRQALLSETGGGSTSSCEQYLCQQIQWLGQNTDVFLGYVGWAAGSFGDPSQYPLSLTPTNNGGSWTDTPIMSQCLSRA